MVQLTRRLGPLDVTMIVVSGIIGAGIFTTSHDVAKLVDTPALILAVWIAGGVIALCGAFVFAELSTVLPQTGGQYAFFREAFHPLVGFLHGWSLLLIIQSGATAYVAVACGQYVVRIAGLDPSAAAPIGVAILVGLVAFHSLGIKPGAVLINVITLVKIAAIAALVVGAFAVSNAAGIELSPVVPQRLAGGGLTSAFFAALLPAMFTYGGWQNSNFVTEEIRDPQRTLPRAILIGVLIVIAVYVGTNVAYVYVLGAPALAVTETPAADLAARIAGEPGAIVLSALVVISAFGFMNVGLATAPRVYYAMARDGLFFASAAKISPRTHAPVVALVAQGALAIGFALTNAYGKLLSYATFADWIFFSLAGVALMVFRRTRPAAPRPYPAPLYPLIPLVFALVGFGIVINTYIANLESALQGTVIIAVGVPVFFLWRRWRARRA